MNARTIRMVTAAVLFASMAGLGTFLPPLQAQRASAGNIEATTSPSNRTAKEEPAGSIGAVFETASMASSVGKLVVKNVVDDGPAANAGIKAGDEIQTLDGKTITSVDQLTDVVSKHPVGSSVKVEYLRAGQHLQCVVAVVERKQLYRNWYAKLAQRGDPEGEYNFAMTYYRGLYGTAQDYKSAFLWFSKAADHGVGNALLALGNMYAEGQGVTKDAEQALKFWQKAAEQGNAPAQYYLAGLYYEGRGVGRNYALAMQWFRKSAEQGYAQAQAAVGSMYENGSAGSTNFGEAMAWYQKAAQQGFAPAQFCIGNLYAQGRGVQKDLQQARLWYERAVQAGNSDAKKALEALEHPSNRADGLAQEQAVNDAYFAKQRAQQAAADAAAMTYEGCCNTRAEAVDYCKRWVAGWDKDSPAWEESSWKRRWFAHSTRDTADVVTDYCPKIVIDQYTKPLFPGAGCYDSWGKLHANISGCDVSIYKVTEAEKQLAEMATAKDADFISKRCQTNDPRPAAMKDADGACIRQKQEQLEAKRLEEERKKAEQAEAKHEAQLKLTQAARRQTFKTLGLHRLQSQAEVKSLLLAQGFGPWNCETEKLIEGYVTSCLASRRKGSPDQDNVLVQFVNVVHQHRDTDSGIVQTDGVERVLLIAKYARENDEEEVVFGDDNKPF